MTKTKCRQARPFGITLRHGQIRGAKEADKGCLSRSSLPFKYTLLKCIDERGALHFPGDYTAILKVPVLSPSGNIFFLASLLPAGQQSLQNIRDSKTDGGAGNT